MTQRFDMSTFKSFEEINAWQRGRDLTNLVYKVTAEGKFARDFALCDQMRRASISIMSNIAEGFERDGTKEFIQFLSVARGSAGEIRSQLYVALDQHYLSEAMFEQLSSLALEIARMLSGLMQYLRRSGMKGSKFKS
jgi:four helix bundle protein